LTNRHDRIGFELQFSVVLGDVFSFDLILATRFLPCSEEAFPVYWRIGDGRRQAPVRHALELLDAHLLAELCVGYDDQWLPSHVKSAGRWNQNYLPLTS
jgi:hypothetical protein